MVVMTTNEETKVRKKAKFSINGRQRELSLFEKGDRVTLNARATVAIHTTGTVESTTNGGLFVNVKWDKKLYPSKMSGHVTLSSQWMIDSLVLIQE